RWLDEGGVGELTGRLGDGGDAADADPRWVGTLPGAAQGDDLVADGGTVPAELGHDELVGVVGGRGVRPGEGADDALRAGADADRGPGRAEDLDVGGPLGDLDDAADEPVRGDDGPVDADAVAPPHVEGDPLGARDPGPVDADD